jgi:hypothetical protein
VIYSSFFIFHFSFFINKTAGVVALGRRPNTPQVFLLGDVGSGRATKELLPGQTDPWHKKRGVWAGDRRLFMALMVIAITFTACDKDEAGVFNPDKQISKVYTQDLGEPKYMTEQWTWDGKTLSLIQYYEENTLAGSEAFTYEDGRLTKVTDNYGYYSVYTYDEKHYAKIEYYSPVNVLLSDITFTYTEEKVTGMTINTYTITKQFVQMLQRGIVGKILPKYAMEEVIKKSVLQEGNASKEATSIVIVYDGDNISSITIGAYAISFAGYDTKINPRFNFAPFSTYYENANSDVFCKNNPGSTSTTIDNNTITTTYIYTYEGDFPTVVEATTTFSGINISETITIEYN